MEGAPAGIAHSFAEAGALFPQSVDDGLDGDLGELLARDEVSFRNYAGFDQDDEAMEELLAFHKKGFLENTAR